MGVGSTVWGNFKNNVLGITEKAIIEVIDTRERKVKENEVVSVSGNQAGEFAKTPVKNPTGEDTMVTRMVDAGILQDSLEATHETTDPKNETKLSKGLTGSDVSDFEGVKAKYFTVQFNPGTIRLSGHSGGLVKKTKIEKETETGKSTGGGIEYGPGKTYIEFSVSLFFDKVDAMDAFMEDKIQSMASPVNMIKGAAKLGMSTIGKKSRSVQPEVEAFIAALRNEKTRLITFHWGDFNYSGVLRNVNAVYSMFNVNGQPIRATVDLTMTCADSELMKRSIIRWNKMYFDAFAKGSKSYVTVAQQAKSLVNI